MKKSKQLVPISPANVDAPKLDLDFELPSAPDFVSKRVRLPFEQILLLCEETLEAKLADPNFEKERLARKVHAEFTFD